jgi:DNA-binding CsgD family transcriptional regulator
MKHAQASDSIRLAELVAAFSLGIPLASRIASLAEFVEVAHRSRGLTGAVEIARGRSGRQFDPKVAGLLVEHAAEILDDLDKVRAWSTVIQGEPSLAVMLDGDEFDAALLAVADFVDLKSPYTLGHSAAVAALAEGAATGAREVEVLQLLARGLSTKQIGERLFVSSKTAGNHIEHIYSKIGVTNRVGASLFAVQHGLLPEG